MREKPKGPPQPPVWLTNIPARSYSAGGQWKFHKHLGYAKNSLRAYASSGGELYKWNAETAEFDLICTVERGSDRMPWDA